MCSTVSNFAGRSSIMSTALPVTIGFSNAETTGALTRAVLVKK